jgi:serum/glucocorticoid-regulated kinase 2
MQTPFYDEDHGMMYRRVLHEQLDFGPSDFVDADTRALLRGLLQKEPEFRMTTSRVKRAKYFEAIDWQL